MSANGESGGVKWLHVDVVSAEESVDKRAWRRFLRSPNGNLYFDPTEDYSVVMTPKLPPVPPQQPQPACRVVNIPAGCEGYGIGDRWVVKPRETPGEFWARVIIGALVAGITSAITMTIMYGSNCRQ